MNLLASGYSNPTNGSGGSGIYAFNGEDNIKIFYAPTTQLIISDVPKLQTNNKTFKPSANKVKFISISSSMFIMYIYLLSGYQRYNRRIT